MRYLPAFVISLLMYACSSPPPQAPPQKIIQEYTLDEKDLVPEGIAYSAKNDAFYLTSVGKRKIVAVDRETGKQIDFIQEHEYSYAPGVGILVDDERNLLHALGGYYMSNDSLTSLFTFDLTTKKLLKKYSVQEEGEHFLNDLIQDKAGNIYLTDSKDASVYILKAGNDSLELFFKSQEILFPNGIAISDDNTHLYIASIPKGVRVLDIAKKRILNPEDSLRVSQGIDGLEFYKGHLYGVQNSAEGNPFNFRKLILNKAQTEIVAIKVIDSNSPALDVPLTFCIMGDQAVVIGNSNLQYLNQETLEFPDADSIKKTRLLVYPLKGVGNE